MEISYGIMCRRKRQKKPPFNLPPFLWRAPHNAYNLTKTKYFINVSAHYLVQHPQEAPPWRRIHEQKEDTKCENVRVALPSCARVLAGERLRTDDRQSANARRTRSQPVPASHSRKRGPPTARAVQLEWRA